MKVSIKGTNTTRILGIVDPETGLNFVSDFIGNAGGFLPGGEFTVDDDGDVSCSIDAYNWWLEVTDEHQRLLDHLYSLSMQHGADAVREIVAQNGHDDLELHPASVWAALEAVGWGAPAAEGGEEGGEEEEGRGAYVAKVVRMVKFAHPGTRSELSNSVFDAVCLMGEQSAPFLDSSDDWASTGRSDDQWTRGNAPDFSDPGGLGEWPGFDLKSVQELMQDVFDAYVVDHGDPSHRLYGKDFFHAFYRALLSSKEEECVICLGWNKSEGWFYALEGDEGRIAEMNHRSTLKVGVGGTACDSIDQAFSLVVGDWDQAEELIG